jgi:hypothetical protein
MALALAMRFLTDARAEEPKAATKPAPAESAPAKSAPAKSAPSLDDELFKDLDDGIGKPKTGPKPADAKPADTKPAENKSAETRSSDAKPSESKPVTESKPSAEAKPLPKPANPLDAELLKQLEGDQPEKKKPKSQPKPSPGGGQGKSDSDDPLVRLSRRIREAESRIRQGESGEETQRLQREITEDLEKLIAQIEQQQQQQGKSKGPPQPGQKPGGQKPGDKQPGGEQKPGEGDSSNPAKDSSENLRNMKDRTADPDKLKKFRDQVWGMLPERQRQDVMQSSVDDFPVKYQYVIEEFFRTLLERRE